MLSSLLSNQALHWKPEKRSELCNLGAEVIRPSTRCFSFLGHQLVPLLGALFKAAFWHFVFWQELWRLPRSAILKREYAHTEAPSETTMSHDELWHTRLFRSTSGVVCYATSHRLARQTQTSEQGSRWCYNYFLSCSFELTKYIFIRNMSSVSVNFIL